MSSFDFSLQVFRWGSEWCFIMETKTAASKAFSTIDELWKSINFEVTAKFSIFSKNVFFDDNFAFCFHSFLTVKEKELKSRTYVIPPLPPLEEDCAQFGEFSFFLSEG